MDEHKRRTTSGKSSNAGPHRPAPPKVHNRARAAARRRRKQRQRRMILGLGLLMLIILAAVIGMMISGQRKSRENAALQAEGIAYLDQGNYDAAIQSFTEILAKNKGKNGKQETTVLLYKAEAEYKKGDYPAALATSEALIAADGEKEEYLKLKSRCQLELGDYDAARSTYPSLAPVVYNRMALNAINEERYQDALVAIESGLAAGETEATQSLLRNQAVVYVCMGDYDKALTLFESYEQKYGPDEQVVKEIEFLKTR